jgi:hypothetical protein
VNLQIRGESEQNWKIKKKNYSQVFSLIALINPNNTDNLKGGAADSCETIMGECDCRNERNLDDYWNFCFLGNVFGENTPVEVTRESVGAIIL